MTLMFDVVIDKNQYSVGLGSVPVRIQNIRSSSGSYLSARFYLSSSGKGKFSDYIYTASDGRIYMSFNATIGSNGSYNTKECIYTPEEAGTHIITVVGVPYSSDGPRTSEGATVTAITSVSAMYCDYARAMFTTSVTDGYAPLTVQFNCTTPNQNISTLWDFGDGSTSTQRNPSHTYNTAGQYRPKLAVTGWANPACAGTAPSNSISDRIIDVFKQGAPQCVVGIRCNYAAGFYEECVNNMYRLTTTVCGATTTKAAVESAQAAYTQVMASATARGASPATAVQEAIVAASVASASTGSPAPIYSRSVSTATAGGGSVDTTGVKSLFPTTTMFFNPIILAAAGLGIAGLAIYFWKKRS